MELFMPSIWSIIDLEKQGMHLNFFHFLIPFQPFSKETEGGCVWGKFILWDREHVMGTTVFLSPGT